MSTLPRHEEVLTPMKYQELNEKNMHYLNEDYIALEKLDGCLGIIKLGKENRIYSSLKIDRTETLKHLCNFTIPEKYHGDFVLGEIYHPSYTSAEISGMIKTGKNAEKLRFYVFDYVNPKNLNILYVDRLIKLKFFLLDMDKIDKPEYFDEPLEYSGLDFISSIEQLLKKLSYIPAKEGVVFHNLRATYHPGKRPQQVAYKYKHIKTWDVILLGFTEGKGKYSGQIGSFKYGMYPNKNAAAVLELGSCSGMSDQVRLDMTHNPSYYIGKVIEVEGMEMFKSGAIRQPRFKRIRENINPISCNLDMFS